MSVPSSSSTPIKRFKTVRRSLFKIKVNTVSGIIHLFNQSKKSADKPSIIRRRSDKSKNLQRIDSKDSESENQEENKSTDKSQSQINDYITFFNDLSKGFSPNFQKPLSPAEFALNSKNNIQNYAKFEGTRPRSQSLNAKPINKQANIIEKYKDFPNFKWSYLKYFGEDPAKFLSRHGVNLPTNIYSENTTTGPTIKSNQFHKMRKRAQSCNAQISKPTSVVAKYRDYPNFKLKYLKYFGVDPTHYLLSHNDDVDKIASTKTVRKELLKSNGFAGQKDYTSKMDENCNKHLSKTKESNFQRIQSSIGELIFLRINAKIARSEKKQLKQLTVKKVSCSLVFQLRKIIKNIVMKVENFEREKVTKI